MNTRTTLYLAVIFGLLVVGYLWVARPGPQQATEVPSRSTPASGPTAARPVLDDDLGEIVRIKVERPGNDQPWVFETAGKDESGYFKWRMVSPVDMPVRRYDVERIGRTLKNLQYEISYPAGPEGEVTPASAGLEPPRAVVTITDEEADSATLEIGNPASASSTFVRLPGEKNILLGTTAMGDLIHDQAVKYRETLLWTFETDDVERIEIVDQTDPAKPIEYVFVPEGVNGWRMTSPANARATDKVQQMAQTFGRMRVLSWKSDDPARLRGYGFEPAAIVARAVVREEVPVADDADPDAAAGEYTPADEAAGEEEGEAAEDAGTEAPPKTRTVEKTYVFELSSQSPIGEENKVYLRVGGQAAVGDLLTAAGDKFKPDASWRDQRLTTTDVRGATRVEIENKGGSFTLAKRGGGWFFGEDQRAEDAQVRALLDAVANIKAVVFEDGVDASDPQYGLADPQATVRMTVPGAADTERFDVGAYTDQISRGLVYVRRGDSTSIAKVRTAEVEALLRGPEAYRDLTVFSEAPESIEKLELRRPNPFTGKEVLLTFERRDGQWRMTAPVEAEVERGSLEGLVRRLATLRAESIVGSDAELSAFGLHDPQIKLALFSQQAQSEAVVLQASLHDGKLYGTSGKSSTVYLLPVSLYEELMAEFRPDRLFVFQAEDVAAFEVESGGVKHRFERRNEKWVYATEPDLPLDKTKVENHLLQIGDLRVTRYADYDQHERARFGLNEPAARVVVELANEPSRELVLSATLSSVDAYPGRFASLGSDSPVLLVPPDSLDRVTLDLADLEP